MKQRVQCFCGNCAVCRSKEAYRKKRIAKGACRCGMSNCDCERWERIYRERIEDPEYYTREPEVRGRLQSSLAWAIRYALPLDEFGPLPWDRRERGARMRTIIRATALAADDRRHARS